MDEKEYLQGILKIPSVVGARGVNAIYEEVKKQGKAYDNKTKSGFTLAKIKEWYQSREKVQTHKKVTEIEPAACCQYLSRQGLAQARLLVKKFKQAAHCQSLRRRRCPCLIQKFKLPAPECCWC